METETRFAGLLPCLLLGLCCIGSIRDDGNTRLQYVSGMITGKRACMRFVDGFNIESVNMPEIVNIG